MQLLPIKLEPGSDLRQSIQDVGRDHGRSGFVVSIVGNLSSACFQCPDRTNTTTLEGNLEIITLNGTFSKDSVHLHLSISDGNCQVWGGHLEPGSLILKGADILLCPLGNEDNNDNANLILNFKPRIEIAVIPGCPWSSRAIRLLRSLDIPHDIKTINDDKSFKLLKDKTGLTIFPQIFVDGKLLGGYESLDKLNTSGKLLDFK